MKFIVLGQPFSKANSRRLVKFGNRIASIKSEKALGYEAAAGYQLRAQMRKAGWVTLERPVGVEVHIYYPDRRQDLDPSLIFDVMQKAGVYKNDRLIEEMHLFRHIDKANPRSEIDVWELYAWEL